MNTRQDKSLLLNTAKAVFKELEHRTEGTSLRLRWPNRLGVVNTGGWRAFLGSLGKGQPRLQIWLDHFAGYKTRKFNFCFYLNNIEKMRRLAKRVAKELPLHRRITEKDMEDGDKYFFLQKRLRKNEFGAAILEEYWSEYSYYGIYDLTIRLAGNQVSPKLCARAASFFESVARAQGGKPENIDREVYPKVENRKLVVSHLQRERNSYLATERKIHDDYTCQVCGLRFENRYGKLGQCFAEAHHRIPLYRLKGKIKTHLEDLATVCANCHRMLHKMEGKRNDVEKLEAIVRKHKSGSRK